MTIKVHLPCRARGQERVQRCGYAAFCLNSQKGEQQDRRGDYPRISTNPRLGDLHRHRREALRAPGPAAGRRRLPPVAFQGVLGDLVNNQVPPLFRINIKSDHMDSHLFSKCFVFSKTFVSMLVRTSFRNSWASRNLGSRRWIATYWSPHTSDNSPRHAQGTADPLVPSAKHGRAAWLCCRTRRCF